MSANAPVFVPMSQRSDAADSYKNRLPESTKAMLRQVYQALTGEVIAYYVGYLKSFNNRNGYGFLECEQAKKDYGADVFIHKNLVPTPWTIGQPIEFAVHVNNRGQPQARDVSWLPPLEPDTRRSGAPSGQASSPAPPGGAAADGARSSSAKAWIATPQEMLGAVKSFSAMQGYGFFSHDDKSADVYFDRTSLPLGMEPRPGQMVSYVVHVNARGQNQARQINWDPVPHMPESPPLEPGRRYGPEAMGKLRELLSLRYAGEIEKMVIMAIDNSGKPGAPPSPDGFEIDYASFTLDRIGDQPPAPGEIKDFVKMLLMLMLAKMMKNQINKGRCQRLISWFEAMCYQIDPTAVEVVEHIQGVVNQASSDLKIAQRENPIIREAPGIVQAFQHLMAKVQQLG